MKFTEARKLVEEPSNAESLQCLLEEASKRLHRHVLGKVLSSVESTQRLQQEPEPIPPERGLIYF